MGSVLDDLRPKGWHVEQEIRVYLRAIRRKDISTEACKAFARELIEQVAKKNKKVWQDWIPGEELTHPQAQQLGRAFDVLLETKRSEGWKVARLEQPPFKHRDEMTEQDWRVYRRRASKFDTGRA